MDVTVIDRRARLIHATRFLHKPSSRYNYALPERLFVPHPLTPSFVAYETRARDSDCGHPFLEERLHSLSNSLMDCLFLIYHGCIFATRTCCFCGRRRAYEELVAP